MEIIANTRSSRNRGTMRSSRQDLGPGALGESGYVIGTESRRAKPHTDYPLPARSDKSNLRLNHPTLISPVT